MGRDEPSEQVRQLSGRLGKTSRLNPISKIIIMQTRPYIGEFRAYL